VPVVQHRRRIVSGLPFRQWLAPVDALSPQCGFATSVAGNVITTEAQRAKLALLVRAARDFVPA
jgi:hypothetical protein